MNLYQQNLLLRFASLVSIGAGVYLFYTIFIGSYENSDASTLIGFIAFSFICMGGITGYHSITYNSDYY